MWRTPTPIEAPIEALGIVIMIMAVTLFSMQVGASSPGYLVLAICQQSTEYGALGYHQRHH